MRQPWPTILKLAVLVAGATLLAAGRDTVWTILGGPADQGPVAFETLERRRTPNDFLVCPASLCRAAGDVEAPVFAAAPIGVNAALRRIIVATPLTTIVEEAEDRFRVVARTPIMRYPDTVAIRIVPRGEGSTTVAIYSRSLLGSHDYGVNRARVTGWLAALEKELHHAPD
jgi:uncharacterized protein (DUF1499 family)